MKNLMIILVAFSTFLSVSAQSPEVAREKMKPFESWVGHWKGEGSMRMGPGEPKKSAVDETILRKLDGTVVLVEGIGKSINESGNEVVSHHALGILAYDQTKNEYQFSSYLVDGHMTDAWFTIEGDNRYQWGFDTPRGKIRYSITLDPVEKTWSEIGEFSADGNNWMQFFTMDLIKVD